MPWFITAIQVKEVGVPDSRTFGFFNSHVDAFKAVEKNVGNMHECLYKHLVVEYIEEGIHPCVYSRYWWKWEDKSTYFEPSHWVEDKYPPAYLTQLTNWGIG
jgi:hypothetical protein